MQYLEIGTHLEENRMSAHLVLGSGLKEVTAFMDYLLKMLSASDFHTNDLFAIQLAVEEALLNAVKHGNRMDRRKVVHVRFAINPAGFRIQIKDEGHGYEPDAVLNATGPIEDEQQSGRGLWLIRHYMHNVSFNAKGNKVTLVRRRSPA